MLSFNLTEVENCAFPITKFLKLVYFYIARNFPSPNNQRLPLFYCYCSNFFKVILSDMILSWCGPQNAFSILPTEWMLSCQTVIVWRSATMLNFILANCVIKCSIYRSVSPLSPPKFTSSQCPPVDKPTKKKSLRYLSNRQAFITLN